MTRYCRYTGIACEFATEYGYCKLTGCVKRSGDRVANDLYKLPTVDAVPVRHGRWIIGDDGALHCSKCSKTPISRIIVHGIQIFDMAPVKEMMKYCPSCGAKMDEEDEDDE